MTPNVQDLLASLQRIKRLTDELTAARQDAAAQRKAIERLGPELDAARKALRPQFQAR